MVTSERYDLSDTAPEGIQKGRGRLLRRHGLIMNEAVGACLVTHSLLLTERSFCQLLSRCEGRPGPSSRASMMSTSRAVKPAPVIPAVLLYAVLVIKLFLRG